MSQDPQSKIQQLVGEAANAARLIAGNNYNVSKVPALSKAGKMLAASDMHRSVFLFGEAEKLLSAPWGDYEFQKNSALEGFIYALAETDPDRAELLAKRVKDELDKSRVLGSLAHGLAPTDPYRAVRIARMIPLRMYRAVALCKIAQGLTSRNGSLEQQLLDEAEHAFQADIVGARDEVFVLRTIADLSIARDPERAIRLFNQAERVARSGGSNYEISEALSLLGSTIAASSPARAAQLFHDAERIAKSDVSLYNTGYALSALSREMASTNLDRALEIAHLILEGRWRASALAKVAAKICPNDPRYAALLLEEAEPIARSVAAPDGRAWVLLDLADGWHAFG